MSINPNSKEEAMSLIVHVNPLKKEEAHFSKMLERRAYAEKQIRRNLPAVWHNQAMKMLGALCKYDTGTMYPTKVVVSKSWPTSGNITVYRSDNRKYRLFYDGKDCKFKSERQFND
tara:strand:- start:184 stop:531 length:348 start_codon:yes stop_codon:yes gene_type:complete